MASNNNRLRSIRRDPEAKTKELPTGYRKNYDIVLMRYVKDFARVVSRVPKKFIRVIDKAVGSF